MIKERKKCQRKGRNDKRQEEMIKEMKKGN